MKINWKNYWPVYFVLTVMALLFGWTIYCEIEVHYLSAFNGQVIEKLQTPPKKMPDLIVKGSEKEFPLWKWIGVDFDSVRVGDSIFKKKYENAIYFKKLKDRSFQKIVLKYWTD